MQTQLVGYSDERGSSKPTIVAGPETTREAQMKIWVDAKTKHKFPKGIVKLVLVELVEIECAIFISDDVTAENEAFANAEAKRVQDAKDAKAAAVKKADDLRAAIKAVSSTAVNRNAANSALNVAKQNNADKSKQESLQKAFDAADKVWQDAKAKLAELQKPATENKVAATI